MLVIFLGTPVLSRHREGTVTRSEKRCPTRKIRPERWFHMLIDSKRLVPISKCVDYIRLWKRICEVTNIVINYLFSHLSVMLIATQRFVHYVANFLSSKTYSQSSKIKIVSLSKTGFWHTILEDNLTCKTKGEIEIERWLGSCSPRDTTHRPTSETEGSYMPPCRVSELYIILLTSDVFTHTRKF